MHSHNSSTPRSQISPTHVSLDLAFFVCTRTASMLRDEYHRVLHALEKISQHCIRLYPRLRTSGITGNVYRNRFLRLVLDKFN
jgi:hypothetical protein